MDPIDFTVPPVVKTVQFAGTAQQAFDRFTQAIGSWWPLATHSLAKDNADTVAFERLEAGARLIERTKSGEQHIWGAIIDIDRPHLVRFSWHVGRDPDSAQTITVTFNPDGEGTTSVTLTQSGWERLGARAAQARADYNDGWNPVLLLFAQPTG